MTFSVQALFTMARDTLRDPQGEITKVLGLPYPRAAWWQALGVLVIASLLLAELVNLIFPTAQDPLLMAMSRGPLVMALFQAGLAVAMVMAVYHVGRIMGGTGSFDGALRITVWLHFVMFWLQLAQTIVLFILPPLVTLTGFLIMGLNLWLLTNFVARLHGFRSLGGVFAMIIVTFFVVSFVFVTALGILGISIFPEISDV